MENSLAEDFFEGFPIVLARGPITEESLPELGIYIREICEQADVQGAILDCRYIEGVLSPESLYRATPNFTDAVGPGIKVAYVNRPKSWPQADGQFTRDIAYNRGGLLEVFETKHDAVRWLRQD